MSASVDSDFNMVWQEYACVLAIIVVLVTHWKSTHPSPPLPPTPPDYLSSFTFYI